MGDALTILEPNAPEQYVISDEQTEMIFAWEEFRIATKIKIIGFPIWINSFGVGYQKFAWYKRKIGYDEMPKWKQRFVDNNRKLYEANEEFIDDWLVRHDMLNKIKLYQKFEWNCGTDVADIRDTIIQIRQSGIRAKRPTFYPSLVAMVNTPIIWDKEKGRFRQITPREAANLQSFHGAYKFTGSENQIYQQLGNSVNVKILKKRTSKLFSFAQKGWDTDEEK